MNADLLILAQLVRGFSLPRWEREWQSRAGHMVALQEVGRKGDAGSRLPPFILSWCPVPEMVPPVFRVSSPLSVLHTRPELCLTNLQSDSKSRPVKNGLQRKSSLITTLGGSQAPTALAAGIRCPLPASVGPHTHCAYTHADTCIHISKQTKKKSKTKTEKKIIDLYSKSRGC